MRLELLFAISMLAVFIPYLVFSLILSRPLMALQLERAQIFRVSGFVGLWFPGSGRAWAFQYKAFWLRIH